MTDHSDLWAGALDEDYVEHLSAAMQQAIVIASTEHRNADGETALPAPEVDHRAPVACSDAARGGASGGRRHRGCARPPRRQASACTCSCARCGGSGRLTLRHAGPSTDRKAHRLWQNRSRCVLRAAMGYRPIKTCADAARHGFFLEITCGKCGRIGHLRSGIVLRDPLV